jgi:hypothetical protein
VKCPHCGMDIRNAKRVSTTETREQAAKIVDEWNDLFRGHLNVAINIPFVERALFAQYSQHDIVRVFLAVKDKRTQTCVWLAGDGKRYRDLYHLTRPPYTKEGSLRPGLLHKILEELGASEAVGQVRRISEEEI